MHAPWRSHRGRRPNLLRLVLGRRETDFEEEVARDPGVQDSKSSKWAGKARVEAWRSAAVINNYVKLLFFSQIVGETSKCFFHNRGS